MARQFVVFSKIFFAHGVKVNLFAKDLRQNFTNENLIERQRAWPKQRVHCHIFDLTM